MIAPPAGDAPDLLQTVEDFTVEQLIPQAGIEALDIAILPRAAGLDIEGGDAGQAFDAALKRVGVTAASDVSTREIETYEALSRDGGKGWATAASTTLRGVPMSLFAITGLDKTSGIYATDLYLAPTSDYRRWGGVMKMLYAVGMTEHLEGLPANFTDQVRDANTGEQVQIFAHLIDITTMRVFGEMMQARQGLLQTLQGVGKDIETRTHCQSIEGCSFTPGALPGQGSYSLGGR